MALGGYPPKCRRTRKITMEAIKQNYANLKFYQERSQRLNYWVDYNQILGADAAALPMKSENLSSPKGTSKVSVSKRTILRLANIGLWLCWTITALLFISIAFTNAPILPVLGILSLWISLSVTRTTDQLTKQNK